MSKDFPKFFFDCPTVTMRIDSSQGLADLLVVLTAKYNDRRRAVLYLSCALTCATPVVDTAAVPTFGHDGIYADVPTLGDWLSERGVIVE